MPYRCPAGKLTIGVGRNLDAKGISTLEAMMMLANDINATLDGLIEAFPWWERLDDARSRVLISMAFNLGIDGLRKFRHFLSALEAGDYERAAAEMRNSAWYGQVGERGPKLVRWMLTGQSLDSEDV